MQVTMQNPHVLPGARNPGAGGKQTAPGDGTRLPNAGHCAGHGGREDMALTAYSVGGDGVDLARSGFRDSAAGIRAGGRGSRAGGQGSA